MKEKKAGVQALYSFGLQASASPSRFMWLTILSIIVVDIKAIVPSRGTRAEVIKLRLAHLTDFIRVVWVVVTLLIATR